MLKHEIQDRDRPSCGSGISPTPNEAASQIDPGIRRGLIKIFSTLTYLSFILRVELPCTK